MAAPPNLGAPQRLLTVVGLVLIVATTSTAGVPTQLVEPFGAGLDLGVNVDPSNPKGNATYDNVTTLGSGWVRIEYQDSAAAHAPPSPLTLSFYQRVVAEFASKTPAVQVLLILDYQSLQHRPAPTDSNATWASYIDAFASRCSDVASAIKADAFEVWNEPDLPHVGNIPPEHFGPLLQAAYQALKRVAPSATVVMGGLASGDPAFVANVRAAAGGTLPCDAVGVHPYGQRPTPDWPSPTWGFGVLTELLQRYYDVEPKELWITEVGTQDMQAQPDFPNHVFSAVASELAASGVCRHVFWFCWSDGMVSPFGLVDTNGAVKDSYTSFQSFARNQSSITGQ